MKTIEFFQKLREEDSIDKLLKQNKNLSKEEINKHFDKVFELLSDEKTTTTNIDSYELYTDGASRGNPGDAGIGFVIKKKGYKIEEHSKYIGKTTNNVAEYTALIEGLKRLIELGVKNVSVFSDSELMVKQIKKEYSVKNKNLRNLYEKVNKLIKQFDTFRIQHILRDKNIEADALSKKGSADHSM